MSNPEYFECPRCHLNYSLDKGVLCENCNNILLHQEEAGEIPSPAPEDKGALLGTLTFPAATEDGKDSRWHYIKVRCGYCKQEWGYMLSQDTHLAFIQQDLGLLTICNSCFKNIMGSA